MLELCELGALNAIVKGTGVLAEHECAAVLFEVTSGLRYLHEEHSLVHRDLKAANVMLTWDAQRDATVRIVDFGISKQVATTTSTMIGTPLYMSPEVIRCAIWPQPFDASQVDRSVLQTAQSCLAHPAGVMPRMATLSRQTCGR